MTKTLSFILLGGAVALASSVLFANRSATAASEQVAWCQPPVTYPLKVRKPKAIERRQADEVAWCQPPVTYPLKVRKPKAAESRERTFA